MENDKTVVAGYGLHYHANNRLIPKLTDRVVMQCLIDMVRIQLKVSPSNQTVFTNNRQLGNKCGIDSGKTIPGALSRLEKLGLIENHGNAITVNCDFYVTIIQYYESLNSQDRILFAKEFLEKGPKILENSNISVEEMCRMELLGMSGASITCTNNQNVWKTPTFLDNDGKNIGNFQTVGKTPIFLDNECENVGSFQTVWRTPNIEVSKMFGVLQHFTKKLAEYVGSFQTVWSFPTFLEESNIGKLQTDTLKALKMAFEYGELPISTISDPEKCLETSNIMFGVFQHLTPKMLEVSNTVIIEDKQKKIKGESPQKNEDEREDVEDENSQFSSKKDLKVFEGFGKVDIIDLENPSEEFLKDEDLKQKKLKRAERALKVRNPYKDKPFFPVEKFKEIVEAPDEVVKSPVDFFLYFFWWGLFDLYCDHYQPSLKIDDHGEPVDDPQTYDWKEMVGAPLPQDEIYSLAKNVYEDLTGAVEQGKYIYGDNNEWEIRFAFDSFQDFNPYEIFQWIPCTMQDKSIPALRVAADRFYNIEASDIHTPGKEDRKTKNAQNKKLVNFILSSEDSQLTPIENAIKSFYDRFVTLGEDLMIDEFTDANKVPLESGGGLPDHILKPWCYSQPSVTYDEFVQTFNFKYKPCDGVHKKARVFSADSVIRWNEKNGYFQSVSHKVLAE